MRSDLLAAKDRLSGLTAARPRRGCRDFETVAAEVVAYTARADEKVQGPMWTFASGVPFVGQNVAAVRGAAEATHILVRDALPASFGVLERHEPRQDPARGRRIRPRAVPAGADRSARDQCGVRQGRGAVADIDRDSLLPVVDDAVGELVEVIDEAAPLLRTVEQVLPPALQIAGDAGPRSYLIIFQNNAEIRATGGNPAATVLMRVDQGKMYLETQADSSTFAESGTEGQDSCSSLRRPSRCTPTISRGTTQNFSRTPNFPTTAQLFTSLMGRDDRGAAGGVISIDPVVLSYILSVTGRRRRGRHRDHRRQRGDGAAARHRTSASAVTDRSRTRTSQRRRPTSSEADRRRRGIPCR